MVRYLEWRLAQAQRLLETRGGLESSATPLIRPSSALFKAAAAAAVGETLDSFSILTDTAESQDANSNNILPGVETGHPPPDTTRIDDTSANRPSPWHLSGAATEKENRGPITARVQHATPSDRSTRNALTDITPSRGPPTHIAEVHLDGPALIQAENDIPVQVVTVEPSHEDTRDSQNNEEGPAAEDFPNEDALGTLTPQAQLPGVEDLET